MDTRSVDARQVEQFRTLRDSIIPTAQAVSQALASLPRSTTLPALAALHHTGKHIYAGTANPRTVAANRRRNKAARIARRAGRA